MSESPGPPLSHHGSSFAKHRLPSIPSLPPLDIPRSNFTSSPNVLHTNPSSAHPPNSDDVLPNSAELSVESFTTACSSPVAPANTVDSSGSDNPTPTTQSPTARNLSKSLSVDSFVREQHHQRDATVHTALPEASRTVGQSKSHSRLQSFDPKTERRQAEQPSGWKPTDQPPPLPPRNLSAPALRTLAQRVKRQSRQSGRVNRSEDEVESSPCEDSEFEQSHSGGGKVLTKASRIRRRLSIPKRSGSMPVSRISSELPGARARKAAAAIPAELKNITTAIVSHPSPTHERSHQLRTKASAPTPLEAARRGRSFSIGTQSDDSSVKKAKPPLVLHVDTDRPPNDAILMTLAVIGSRGCGKSAFIRRAWKNSLVTEAARHSMPITDSDGNRILHYITRKVYMQAHEGRDYYLTLIEISDQELERLGGQPHDELWPSFLPEIHGAFVLYDASDESSFVHTEELISVFFKKGIPYIVLACKSDLPLQKTPADAVGVVQKYDGGIVEISGNEAGRDKARRCVGMLLRGVLRRRAGVIDKDKNPCSPVLFNAPAKSDKRQSSPPVKAVNGVSAPNANPPNSATTSVPSTDLLQTSLPAPPSSHSISSLVSATPATPPGVLPPVSPGAANSPQARSPTAPTSPARARSMGDINLMSTQSGPEQTNNTEPSLNRSRSILDLARRSNPSTESVKSLHETGQQTDPEPIIPLKKDQKQESASPWATVDELLEKLLFLCISGDEPSFVTHFFLTYRRFTTPRRILLAMQKRMLELNQPSADLTLAAFAQMRICSLLEQWIQSYPTDFAVPGSTGAFNALIRQILRQPHTLYYGTDFLPFLESLHTLHDLDSTWAVKAETTIDESDESDSNYESDHPHESPVSSPQTISPTEKVEDTTDTSRPSVRERKSSIPLSAKTFLQNSSIRTLGAGTVSPVRDSLQRLQKAAGSLLHFDAEDVAKEITRRELDLYMKIEPRDWLRHTLVPGKKDPNSDRIARFNASYNDLHDWAASLILCHDKTKPKARARVVEKLTEVAVKLRNLNNYSGLRAIITAITQSTYPNDEVMEIFKAKIDLHKKYLSSDILMRTAGAHQSYRLALRNTKGPCIPCLEVHTSDLRRAHEGNPDFKHDDPSKVHWAKFNMIGKFVGTTTELQDQCRGPNGYDLTENPQIMLLFDVPVMDYDMQQERLGPPPDDDGNLYAPPIPPMLEHASHQRDQGVIKRLFFRS
ncbi:hypothetical protein ACEPAG_6321 [Sanghuangporus baumii]